LNYSTYLTKPTWAQATNGTILARLTASNAFGAFNQSFDTNVLFVDATNNRVGIGTASPSQPLHVQGNANITGTLYVSTISSNSPLTLQTAGTTRAYFSDTTGNFGVNTTNPQNTLNVIGTGNFTSGLYVNNKDLELGYNFATNGSFASSGEPLWTANYSTYLTKPTWAQVTNGTLAINSTIAAYIDSRDSTYNSTMKSYVDSKDSTYNSTIKSYIDAKDTSFNSSVAGYVVNVNTTMKSYVDAKDVSFNTTLYNWVVGQGYLTSYTETDPKWTANYSARTGSSGGVVFAGSPTITSPTISGTLSIASSASTELDFTGDTQVEIESDHNIIFDIDKNNNGLNAFAIRNSTTSSIFTLYENGLFSVSDNTLYITQSGGNVGIGTTTPQNKLNVVGDANFTGDLNLGSGSSSMDIYFNSTYDLFDTKGYDAFFTRNIITGDNLTVGGDATIVGTLTVDKINADTIDPVFTIGNSKYSTYAPSVSGGPKEEVTGIAVLKNGSYTIDFNKETVGSDLWLFYQVTDIGKKMENLQVVLTAGFDGNVWYTKDPKTSSLIIHGTSDGEVSYRLTGDRFDHEKWSNYAAPNRAKGLSPPLK